VLVSDRPGLLKQKIAWVKLALFGAAQINNQHNIVVIEQCMYSFHIELPSVQLQRRFEKFLANAADDHKVY